MKSIKEHEEINLHIKRYGFFVGLIKLPFNLLFSIMAFPLMFILSYLSWYDGEPRRKYTNFVMFCYGLYDQDKFKLYKKR